MAQDLTKYAFSADVSFLLIDRFIPIPPPLDPFNNWLSCLTEIFFDEAFKRATELDEHFQRTGKVSIFIV